MKGVRGGGKIREGHGRGETKLVVCDDVTVKPNALYSEHRLSEAEHARPYALITHVHS